MVTLINPGWKRPASWNLPDDWNFNNNRTAKGFIRCPDCGKNHSKKTKVCEECGFKLSEID